IPLLANSIRVSVVDHLGNPVGSPPNVQVVPHPDPGQTQTSQIVFTGLPVDEQVTFKAEAYPSGDGTGIAQASGFQNLLIKGDSQNQFEITMGSTITRIQVDRINSGAPPLLDVTSVTGD